MIVSSEKPFPLRCGNIYSIITCSIWSFVGMLGGTPRVGLFHLVFHPGYLIPPPIKRWIVKETFLEYLTHYSLPTNPYPSPPWCVHTHPMYMCMYMLGEYMPKHKPTLLVIQFKKQFQCSPKSLTQTFNHPCLHLPSQLFSSHLPLPQECPRPQATQKNSNTILKNTIEKSTE